MLGVAAFLLRLILVLAIGGGLFLIVTLLRLSYKERKTLAGQGYGARIRPPQPAYPSRTELRAIENRRPAKPDGQWRTVRQRSTPGVCARHQGGRCLTALPHSCEHSPYRDF